MVPDTPMTSPYRLAQSSFALSRSTIRRRQLSHGPAARPFFRRLFVRRYLRLQHHHRQLDEAWATWRRDISRLDAQRV